MVFSVFLVYSRSLLTPDYIKEYHIGIRNAKNGKLLAFISGTPQIVSVREKPVKMVDVHILFHSFMIR